MNYIAIDTSGKNLTIVICKQGKIFSYFDNECGVKHSEKIMVELENLILKADYDIKSSSFIGCVVGAGSFTGIRIGVATVKALCFAYSLPFLSLTSFDTIAYNKKDDKVLAVIDAGHNGFYVAGYQEGKVVLPPSYIMIDELKNLSSQYSILSLTDLSQIESQKVDSLTGLINAIEEKKDQTERDLEKLIPLYVRKSQAEEGRCFLKKFPLTTFVI